MKYGNVLWTLVIILLSACASGTKYYLTTKPIEGTAKLFVFRPSCPPILFKPTIYINDVKVGELSNRGYIEVDLRPGRYNLKSEWGYLAGVVGRKTEIEFKVEPGKNYYVIVTTKMQVHGGPPPTFVVPVIYGGTAIIEKDTALPLITNCELVEKSAEAEEGIHPK